MNKNNSHLTRDGGKLPNNQAELRDQYLKAAKALKPKTLKTIMALQAKFKAQGLVF